MSPAAFLTLLMDAAARSLLLATAVGCGLWVFRVRHVLALKTAWILVLVSSLAMPLLAYWGAQIAWLPEKDTLVVPGHVWSSRTVRRDAPQAASAATVFVNRSSFAPARPLHRGSIVDRQPRSAAGSAAPVLSAATASRAMDERAAAAAPAPPVTPLLDRVRARIAGLDGARALLLLYLAVTIALLFRLVLGAWAAGRLWRRAEPVSLGRIAITPNIHVRSSSAIASPVTVAGGIVLPAECVAWDEQKLGIVLAHEGSHVRQRDFTVQLAASFHIALFWFNPMSWWLKRKLSRLSETISDGAAVHQAASHASYAQVLLEFAAHPRPIPIGVAMAHRGHLSSRIEHLLNERSFRQAFSGGRMRLAAAVLLVPVALFAATAMVRVHAAGQQAPPAQTAPAAPSQAPVNVPPPNVPSDAAAPAAAPVNIPPPAGVSDDETVAPGAAVLAAPQAPGAPDLAIPAPPPAPGGWGPGNSQAWANDARARALLQAEMAKDMALNKRNFAQSSALLKAQIAKSMAFDKANFFGDGFFNDGNSYAYVTGQGETNTHFSGNWYQGSREEIDKARKVAHGDFIWFERDGKSYVIDDPATLAAVKPMQDQMDALGKQQDELGKQQDQLGTQMEALSKQMEELKVPTPDMKKELEKLQAVQAKLAALAGKDASQGQLAELQSELGDVQGELGALQGEMGGRQGDLGGKMGELGGRQGKLGAEQGRLGAQQGRLAREMDGKVLTIIDESLKNGKARPVQ